MFLIIIKNYFYLIICKWKIHFSNTIVTVKSNPWHNLSHGFKLRTFLLSKIKFYENANIHSLIYLK